MEAATATAVGQELRSMREARHELATAEGYLSTSEAVASCELDISEEKLREYPDWVCPRTPKDPRYPNSAHQWDPRDVRALPVVLKQWKKAREAGGEEDFRRRREKMLDDRDQKALGRAMGGGQ